MISLDKFKELDIRLGTIISAQKVEGTDKLLKLMFDFGVVQPGLDRGLTQIDTQINAELKNGYVQILSGIAEFYDPSVLVGKQVPVIVNLEPRTLKGQVSNGMMLAVVVDDPSTGLRASKPILLHPDMQVPPGSEVK